MEVLSYCPNCLLHTLFQGRTEATFTCLACGHSRTLEFSVLASHEKMILTSEIFGYYQLDPGNPCNSTTRGCSDVAITDGGQSCSDRGRNK